MLQHSWEPDPPANETKLPTSEEIAKKCLALDLGHDNKCVLSRFSHVWLETLWTHSLPDSSVHRILQTRILVWVAMLSSRDSSPPRDWTCVSYIYLHWQEGSLSLVPPGKPKVMSTWELLLSFSVTLTSLDFFNRFSFQLGFLAHLVPSSEILLHHIEPGGTISSIWGLHDTSFCLLCCPFWHYTLMLIVPLLPKRTLRSDIMRK